VGQTSIPQHSAAVILTRRRPALSRLFPYTTLFRSDLPVEYEQDLRRPFLDAVALEVSRALQFFFTSTPHDRVDHIVLTGGCAVIDRKSTRLNSSHVKNSYAVSCLKKKR